jgi:hypothetical protein
VGSDRPPRAWKSDDLEGGTLAVLARVGLRTGLYLLPALVAFLLPYLRDPKEGTHDAASWMRVGAFAAAALLLAPVVLLGSATGNLRMTWPWGAIPWLFRGFRIVLAVAGSWIVLVLAEIVVERLATARSTAGTAFAVCLPMRVVALSLLLSGGRALGVLGRRFAL